MKSVMTMIKNILLVCLLSMGISVNLQATLSVGDIAFIGWNTDTPDGFSIITLTDIPGSEEIYFTDRGIVDASTWLSNTEPHYLFTAPVAGISCGTIISFVESGTANVITITGVVGATYTNMTGGNFNLSAGDQMIAYQTTTGSVSTNPSINTTFIAGVMGDYHGTDTDPITKWTKAGVITAVSESIVPPGLTNGVDCVSLFPNGPESDNAKYTGSLTGTSIALRAMINNSANWLNDNITPYTISPSSYVTPSVTCAAPCSNPPVPTVTFSPATVCAGSASTLSIIGTLNDATQWSAYTGACGGTLIGTTPSSTLVVTPSSPSTTYFVRGEGGCVTPSSCASVTITPTALDNASFSYGAASYCASSADPTPTITGLIGGTFSSSAGLVINASSGIIDVSASTPGTYTVTYTTAGTCPSSSNVIVTINALDDASFSYSASSYCVSSIDPSPTITGLSGGTFSSSAGLVINASSGIIDVSASTPGTYTITYTTAGSCPNSSTVSVTINPLDDASFSYSASSYNTLDVDPTPTITGLGGGTFSSSAGLNLNASTGIIDVSASTPGSYTITYTTAGSCSNSSNTNVTINLIEAPTVISGVTQNITPSSALLEGNATANGGDSITERGIVYAITSTNPNPLILGTGVTKSSNGTGTGTFTASITGLSALTEYSFKAYATNTIGTSYGTVQTFTTPSGVPTATAVPITITVVEDTPSNFNLSSVVFSDLDDTNLTITLAASAGTFTATSSATVTIGGSGTANLTLNGNITEIHIYLDTVSNVQYTGATNVSGIAVATFTLHANDDTVNPQVGSGNIDITAVDDTPTITSTPITAVDANTLYSYELNATNVDGDDLNWTATTLPTWVTLNTTPTRLEGTPSCSNIGVYTVELLLNDGTTTLDHNFTITVNNDGTCTLANIGTDADAGTITLTSTLTAVELNGLVGVSGALVANESNYKDYIINNASAFSAIATVAEVQAMITLVNNHQSAITEVVEDIAGNANNVLVTATELNAIVGVNGAITSTNYTKALEAASYANRTAPTALEIQAVIDAVNAGPDTDNDNIPNSLDEDDDNDGVIDNLDAFPLDPTESNDADNDGWGDNSDPDDDNDGINDYNEITYGLNPLDPTDADADFDNDGISNKDEINNGLNPNDATDADKDFDNDGINNRQEIINGTNPYGEPDYPWLIPIFTYIIWG